MVDFNKLLQKGRELDKFESDKQEIETALEAELNGKSSADYSKNEYAESPINSHTGGVQGIDYGEMMSLTELQENVRFEKMVLFKSYGTQTNRFDRFKSDIMFTFVDRDGIEIRSRAFGELDTSNQISYTEKLKELKGQVVWLDGRLIRKGERYFIDVIKVRECVVDQAVAKEFFKREVAGRQELVKKVWTAISEFPLASAIYNHYEQGITSYPLKDVYERQGGYIYYFSYLMKVIEYSPLDNKIKDMLLTYDLVLQLKQHVNNLELAKILNALAIGKYDLNVANTLTNDVLFGSYSDKSVYEVIIENFKKAIVTLMLLEDWSKWDMDYVYSNLHKSLLAIRREV